MHADAEDCETWHENSDWHSDGDLGEKTSTDTREGCTAACDAYQPARGNLPCNAGAAPSCGRVKMRYFTSTFHLCVTWHACAVQ